MSVSSGKVCFQELPSFNDDDLEVKYKVPKFEALSKKYKKFEEKKPKIEDGKKTTIEPMFEENEEK